MDRPDAIRLFDYLYWSRDRILAAAARVAPDELTSDHPVTTRDLKATLVHELDVEWSWRERLRGTPDTDWGPDSELRPEDFPTLAAIRTRWTADEFEMRRWISGLSVAALSASPPREGRIRLPLSDKARATFIVRQTVLLPMQFRNSTGPNTMSRSCGRRSDVQPLRENAAVPPRFRRWARTAQPGLLLFSQHAKRVDRRRTCARDRVLRRLKLHGSSRRSGG